MLCILKIFYKNPQYFTNCQCKFYSNHCVWFLLPQGQLPNPKIIIIAQQDLNYMSVILKCIVCIVCMKLSRGFIVRFFFSTVRMMKNIVPQTSTPYTLFWDTCIWLCFIFPISFLQTLVWARYTKWFEKCSKMFTDVI